METKFIDLYSPDRENIAVSNQHLLLWAEALESGEYRQGKASLEKDNHHCCLGVACDLFIPEVLKKRRENGDLDGGMPGSQPGAPEWLMTINYDLFQKVGQSFIGMNDDHGLTFKEIAAWIRKIYLEQDVEVVEPWKR